MTVCRHVFCSDCINGVFDTPAARGVVNSEEDDEEEVEALGDSIACPVCRHKLFRKDIGGFTPPEEKKAMTAAEAVESYQSLVWEIPDDESDNESLPDLSSALAPLVQKENQSVEKEEKKEEKIVVRAEPKLPLVTFPEFNPDEDLFELFKNNPIQVSQPKVKASNKTQYWQEVLDTEEEVPSTKLGTLRETLTEWRTDHPEDKILIFSQFTRALDLVEKLCLKEGWNVGRYQGEMTVDERENALRTFEDDDECCILLTSLKCGGVGLNLTGKRDSSL